MSVSIWMRSGCTGKLSPSTCCLVLRSARSWEGLLAAIRRGHSEGVTLRLIPNLKTPLRERRTFSAEVLEIRIVLYPILKPSKKVQNLF